MNEYTRLHSLFLFYSLFLSLFLSATFIPLSSMSFPSRPQEKFKGRVRSSSFNHSVIRRQQSDLLFTNTNSSHRIRRRPSFDSHVHRYEQRPVQPVASHSNFLAVSTKHVHNGASSIDDDSGSEEYNDDDDASIFVRTILDDSHHRDLAGKKK